MQTEDSIVITGAAGFIGSYLTGFLNRAGFNNLILVDDFSDKAKVKNLVGKKFVLKVHREQFANWTKTHKGAVKAVFHLGARTDTTEMDYEVHRKWNLDYSKTVWEYCTRQEIPLVYASSAATYGNGEFGYKDDHSIVSKLHPLNPYGQSKNDFDIWALKQSEMPPFWAGVKFFNVYGPNEYHKGRMASVVFHAFYQIRKTGSVCLFRSHRPDFKDGEQMRDFVFVKDVVSMCVWLMQNQPQNGLYNVGSGKARSFLDLVHAIFKTLNLQPNIEFVDTPEDIRDKYQYFTEADMHKIRKAGYAEPFTSLEEGVQEYVADYLEKEIYF
ncbi:MAG: ADP-glyceromanno-heptose 6-epimerase [Bacteroidetes bacterium]|nr:ADP-glyceromanno-heptose 6-epimerase [Bacteroidota bacterium]MBS1739947.1 ADP-glyceromanno-heptose 6-epimerase [Bacteroidota bacterium]